MMWRMGIWIWAMGLLGMVPVALAVEVTPLASDGSAGAFMSGNDTLSPYGQETRNPHPGWVFVGLVSQPVWEKYGLRPSAFASTGTRSFDPASLPVMPMPKGKAQSRSTASSGKKNGTTAPASAGAGSGKASSAGSKPQEAAGPYSGSAPATGAAPAASAQGSQPNAAMANSHETGKTNGTASRNTSRNTSEDVLHPATGGVTHTRAPSSTQTSGALANKPTNDDDRPRVAIVPETPMPQAPRNSIAPIVLPPNNGRGGLTAI